MSKHDPSLVGNAKQMEQSIYERVRGVCLALANKVGDKFLTTDAQPVVKIRSPNGQTTVAGPTQGAPILHWGMGGFELSSCFDKGDGCLALALESDHGNFLATGKISDPATPRVHDRSLTAVLPLAWRKAIAAAAGELYLGHPGKKLHIKINRDQLSIELDIAGVGAKIVLGAGATQGAARIGDGVTATAGFTTWANGVDAALLLAMSENAFPYTAQIGTVAEGSTEVFIR